MLTDKQKKFVHEYLLDSNGTQAYLRAGYKATPEAARRNAARLLTKADVRSAIDAGAAATLNKLEITREKVLRELARIAFGDRRKVMTWGPKGVKLIDSGVLDDDDAALVAEVSETITATGGSIKMKTHDKVKALELIGRHLALFTDKTEVSGADGGPMKHEMLATLTPADAYMRLVKGQ